jgi:hypothetical protein
MFALSFSFRQPRGMLFLSRAQPRFHQINFGLWR